MREKWFLENQQNRSSSGYSVTVTFNTEIPHKWCENNPSHCSVLILTHFLRCCRRGRCCCCFFMWNDYRCACFSLDFFCFLCVFFSLVACTIDVISSASSGCSLLIADQRSQRNKFSNSSAVFLFLYLFFFSFASFSLFLSLEQSFALTNVA